MTFDQKLASMIDHTLLKAQSTPEQVTKICNEAKEYGFATVCVNPSYIEQAKKELDGSNVGITTVIGFPLGASTSETKAFETKDAISKGATEIDMVINVGLLKSKKWDDVLRDIQSVVDAANGTVVKVILETCYLTDSEIVKACELSVQAQASFVKTSTGFGTGGATAEHITLMRQTVGPEIGVKASGGVRDQKTAYTMVESGATRIGASSSVEIVKGSATEKSDY
ncbi:deoxyribose-phosphate aldolase [Proteinivorax tanatarense]|uniref:Deoxyribose-phosphate aldolase n=1 Tax=Proteinivorax tanatarense TaxID=1260629 RepID=A0AAU7VHY0_9FIRM